MRVKSVVAVGGLLAASLSLTSCIVGVGDWERYSKDFHSSYPMKGGGRLTVETFNGAVDISGWDQDTVDISGTKYGPSQQEADNLKVEIENGADGVSIRVPRPTDRRNNQGARLTIKIPRNAVLDRVTTSNSSIHLEDGAGPAHLRTSNGAIHVSNFHGELGTETSNGPIELERVDGDVRAHTSNGHIRAERINGSVEAESRNGGVNIDVTSTDKSIRIDTSNNSVELTLPPKFSSSVHAQTNNSSITIRMSAGTNARISARTSNASIDTDFEVRAQGELSRNRLEGVIGNGGPLIDLATSNGSIHLLKR